MQRHGREALRRRDDDYEHEEYDEYEEEDYEAEEHNKEENAQPTREELEFLKLREKLKEQIRKDLKKQSASIFGHTSQSQDKNTTKDKCGSFFGPSKPVIAQRVLEESRSIRDIKHITSRDPSSSTGNKRPSSSSSSSVDIRRDQHYRQPKVVNEVKKKAQTLKDMRDYSFLLSDDADFPAPVKEQHPAPRNVPVRSSDTQSSHGPLKSKIQPSKPALASNGRSLKHSVPTNHHTQGKVGPVKGAPVSRPKFAAVESRKVSNASSGNGPGRPIVQKALPRAPQSTSTTRPPTKVTSDQSLRKNPTSLKPSSTQNRFTEQKRPSQESEKVKQMVKRPLPPSRPQITKHSKVAPPRGVPENRLKKRPVNRDLDDEDDPRNIQSMIRNLFGYNPNKYVDNDDDSDMEVGFDVIQKEERRSSKIAKREDEEELHRILEEEEREERARMRKKQRQH